MAEKDDFLSRWSRRKAEARSELKKKSPDGAESAPAPEPAGSVTPGLETTGEGGQVAPREGADAPRAITPEQAEELYKDFDFDKLDYASDYTQFMRKGVPEWIRQRALRKLWVSDPVLANLDGLVEYGEDFTDAALVVKDMASSWKPGQGYRTDEDLQREREEYGPEEDQLAARREREEREAREAEARAAAEEAEEAGGAEGSGEDGEETVAEADKDDTARGS